MQANLGQSLDLVSADSESLWWSLEQVVLSRDLLTLLA